MAIEKGAGSIQRLMAEGVANHVFPGAVLLVSHRERTVFLESYGHADLVRRRPVGPDTVFDLASLTKPLATTLAVMGLVADRALHLDQSVGSALPAFGGTSKSGITVRHLLAHCAGLPAHRPYHRILGRLPESRRGEALKQFLIRETLEYPPGGRGSYSDIGFMILQWIVEEVAGIRLDRLVRHRFYGPLGIDRLFFPEIGSGIGAVRRGVSYAATERCPWRRRVLEGEVHDDNAFVMGGISGHAGLFGTAAAVGRLLNALWEAWREPAGGGPFDSSLVRAFFSRDPCSGRALGFDMPSPEGSSAGTRFSAHSVGHLGFTGTSFWMDLPRGVAVVLLTNRVHPSRSNERIKVFRPRLHDTVMAALAEPAG